MDILVCPVCGAPNQCCVAAQTPSCKNKPDSNDQLSCWCFEFASIEPGQRNDFSETQACLCPRCLAEATKSEGGGKWIKNSGDPGSD